MGEAASLGDLLNAERGLAKQCSRLAQPPAVKQVENGLPAVAPYDSAEVVSIEAKVLRDGMRRNGGCEMRVDVCLHARRQY